MTNFVEYIEQPCLTKAQLAAQLRKDMGITQREAREMIDSFFSLIADSLARGEDVKIAKFGNFELRHKAPRPGRNPRTGDEVTICERKTVKFFASTQQLKRLQGKAPTKTKAPAATPRRARKRPTQAIALPTSPASAP